MNKIIFSFLIVSSSLYSQERSMFGAGDLESDSPYGLTPSEKVIVKNKRTLVENEKKIKNVDGKIANISTNINQFNESIEGINSLVEGNGAKLNKININLNNQINKISNNSNLLKKNTEDMKLFQNELNNLLNDVNTNKSNIKTLQNSFKNIVSLLNKINKDYVTKSEFNKLLDMLDKKVKVDKKTTKKKDNKFSKNKRKLIAEARALFKKDYFTKALPILEHLIEKKYRPAECNFLVGEIKFYRKKYKEAIGYFKTSMLLYDKSKYLPKLLLHSAISFEEIKDNENAKNFYLTLIDIYPESNEAKKASKKIKKLK